MHIRFLLLALLALASFRLAAAAPDASTAVGKATQAWADAFNSREPARILALYDIDAVLWGTTSPTLRNTPAARAEYFSNMPQRPHVRVTFGEQHVRVFGDVAINSGTYTFSNTENGETTSNPARFSLTFRRAGDRWLIVDHHSSAVPPPRR
jgi:uncharacterized protein (TIGR02246 family)